MRLYKTACVVPECQFARMRIFHVDVVIERVILSVVCHGDLLSSFLWGDVVWWYVIRLMSYDVIWCRCLPRSRISTRRRCRCCLNMMSWWSVIFTRVQSRWNLARCCRRRDIVAGCVWPWYGMSTPAVQCAYIHVQHRLWNRAGANRVLLGAPCDMSVLSILMECGSWGHLCGAWRHLERMLRPWTKCRNMEERRARSALWIANVSIFLRSSDWWEKLIDESCEFYDVLYASCVFGGLNISLSSLTPCCMLFLWEIYTAECLASP